MEGRDSMLHARTVRRCDFLFHFEIGVTRWLNFLVLNQAQWLPQNKTRT